MAYNSDENEKSFLEQLNELADDEYEGDEDFYQNRQSSDSRNAAHTVRRRKLQRRKGLKWKLKALLNRRTAIIAIPLAVVLIVAVVIASAAGKDSKAEKPAVSDSAVEAEQKVTSYKIDGVPVIVQDKLKAACETYACTMLLQYYKFDIDEYSFAENYLVTRPVYYGIDGNLHGPDMNSAYAGDIYTGYGINAPGMAKCMNNYIKSTGSKLSAYPLKDIPLEELCEKYVLSDTPVMVWATTYMDEPYIQQSWIVDFVDENAEHKIGDTVSWQMHEHCMVLIGFDEKNYYFCDSVSGKVAAYDKQLSEKRYEQIGKQAIIIK